MIRGNIWSCDRAGDGIERLKYIRDRYAFAGINPVKEVYSKYSSWVEFDNGDIWRVLSASECNRAARSNYAWIDSSVSEEFYQKVIRYTLCAPHEPHRSEFFQPGW